ncbi:L,D-transpeptidase family protein [Pseudoteredinibacter isoporae]|uniref:Murein L,D-transpeptidase YafK n=1 Tax=Pseudoteredinibacter isoporae TaxID=570281 RepID=A0A7X0JX50_9GAMM|nr:L,D-transpeptidase family protein [Pseudoteredinibacter isoporae]MBB6523884.1 murein L,D-transpeptidase YafK [Pseudoteredinibacter isoporae]NHO89254.1 L,D-transpeptidase family protein [Pseudoteredinibacter isoporae]NIB22061.1 L,D-transpeptidase family protein [Pseudoteredinibacter isoporae]
MKFVVSKSLSLILSVLSVSLAAPVFANLQPATVLDLPAKDKYLLVAEMETGRLYAFEKDNGMRLKKVAEYPISIGKQGYDKRIEGDAKTPIGVYRVTSYLTDAQLDDFYGRAAFPLNYPNAWDRLNGYTGSGIWLHGEPTDKKTRPLRDSDGCIVLSNEDIFKVQKYLDVGYTKVVSVPKVEWKDSDEIARSRSEITRAIDDWRKDWMSKSHNRYLSNYSREFNDTEKNYAQWDRYKKRVNGSKRFIKVKLSDLGLYAYPGQDNLVMAEFYQDYRSSNFRSKGWKRQLWKKENGEWKIVYEKGG